MHRISIHFTILITGIVMALSGLVASPIAMASENWTATSSFSFPTGSSVLTLAQKTAIKKVVTTTGADATFLVTAQAGKLPGISDDSVQLLAKKRGQVVTSYLVKLGVSKVNVTTTVKITRLGIVPKTKLVGSFMAPSPTTPVALTCATGGTCVVGDAGPGGGIVFYVSSEGFDCGPTLTATCNYLEAAPTSGTSAWTDARYIWSSGSTPGIGVTAQGTAVGTGYANTLAIVGQISGGDTADYPGTIARAYRGPNNFSDWFLPSKNELNQMCKWARAVAWTSDATVCTAGTLNLGMGSGLGADGFVGAIYWSSSEYNSADAWCQGFSNGNQTPDTKKKTPYYVRPVRAF